MSKQSLFHGLLFLGLGGALGLLAASGGPGRPGGVRDKAALTGACFVGICQLVERS